MNLKMKSIGFFLAIAIMAILSSCDKDDDDVVPKPTISGLEVGYGDSSTVNVGQDLHIEAEILAEGKIDKITVEIHMEGDHDHTDETDEGEEHIEEIEKEYTNYTGQKNATFHEHIEIPENMEAGEYHFHLKVVDQEGNSVSAETELMIKEK